MIGLSLAWKLLRRVPGLQSRSSKRKTRLVCIKVVITVESCMRGCIISPGPSKLASLHAGSVRCVPFARNTRSLMKYAENSYLPVPRPKFLGFRICSIVASRTAYKD